MSTDDRFQIGGDSLIPPIGDEVQEIAKNGEPSESNSKWEDALKEIRVRVGTLLKTETVSLLLGAGASVDCGGVLIGTVPLVVEKQLVDNGIVGTQKPQIRRWLQLFYEAVRCAGEDQSPIDRQGILNRRDELDNCKPTPLSANFEQVLSTLQRWRAALPEDGGSLRLGGSVQLSTTSEQIDECQRQASHALARVCELPTSPKIKGLQTFSDLIRKLLTRPLNLKRVSIFTLNYDTLVEKAADSTGTVLLDGFVGTQLRQFRPESYDQDLYFPTETTEGRVHRLDRVLHLYKLHGSITWTETEPQLSNPYGIESVSFQKDASRSLLIYPSPAKFSETQGMPYSELFRRFAGTLVRSQSVLFVIGYGFGDTHVNAIIRQALAIPSFTLVIVDPHPKSRFVCELRARDDSRIWLSEGSRLGTLAGFVQYVLPDLHEEEILRKVTETHSAIHPDIISRRGSSNGS